MTRTASITPTDAELNQRIDARVAAYRDRAALAAGRGTYSRARDGLGVQQQRAILLLRKAAAPVTPHEIARLLCVGDYPGMVVTIAGLAARGLIVRGEGGAARAREGKGDRSGRVEGVGVGGKRYGLRQRCRGGVCSFNGCCIRQCADEVDIVMPRAKRIH